MKELTPHINPNPACNVAAGGGILPTFGAFTECRRGNLRNTYIGERIAAPTRGVFLFGLSFVRCAFDGGNAQAASAGCFLCSSISTLREAAYPVERVRGFHNLHRNRIMSTLSKAQCIRAQRVQTTLNHLRATARAVRRAVNPYASLDRILSLSSVLRDAAANRRFSSFSNFSIEA